jgi:hypothetical protein
MPCHTNYADKELCWLFNSETYSANINVVLVNLFIIVFNMGNIQGRKHRRKKQKPKPKFYNCDKLVFVDQDDGEFACETHVIGRLPFKEPVEPEIVYHYDRLWQDDNGWNMVVAADQVEFDDSEYPQVEIIELL